AAVASSVGRGWSAVRPLAPPILAFGRLPVSGPPRRRASCPRLQAILKEVQRVVSPVINGRPRLHHSCRANSIVWTTGAAPAEDIMEGSEPLDLSRISRYS
ncbi:hypothetical protein B296_00025128, partial [Ensete ventricosum]